ncbi:MAG TPA: addiction module protein [Balneolales bacterium]|jgi:putative addiction module component (TIGR02574 family)|nr:addiction module protein [Balneolales bacterium]
MVTTNKILKQVMSLKPTERAELIDKLLYSLDKPDSKIDALWAEEAERRIDAYEKGQIKSISLAKVLEKYSRRDPSGK